MKTEINFHPDHQLLDGYVTGKLAAGLNIILSAHIEMCEQCRQKVNAMESYLASQWCDESFDSALRQNVISGKMPNRQGENQDPAENAGLQGEMDLSSNAEMIANIVAQPQQRTAIPKKNLTSEFRMPAQLVELPAVLAKAAAKGLVWTRYAGGINQAMLKLDNETQSYFLYMKPGGQIPVHKHQGREITLVLHGTFYDDQGQYSPADFILSRGDLLHSPITDDGCLCFSVIDSPLTFTKGLSRLLNPLNRFTFNRNRKLKTRRGDMQQNSMSKVG